MTITLTAKPADLERAMRFISDAQIDLRRILSDGERRDLLADNTTWDMDYIAAVVAEVVVSAPLHVEPDPIVSKDRLSIDDDYGSETFIRTIDATTLLGLRNAVRELNCGTIPIYSDYDCTGLVCGQWCKFIKIYKRGAGYVAVVEITVSRDV